MSTICRPSFSKIKPNMRRLHAAQTKKNLIGAICMAIGSSLTFYLTVARARQARYEEYFCTTDFEDMFDEMMEVNMFQAAPAGQPNPT